MTDRPIECPDHWHCDPDAAAHACDAPDRTRLCPTCHALPPGSTIVREVDTFTATEGDRTVTVISESEFVRFPHGDIDPSRTVHPDDWKTGHMFNARTGAIETRIRGELVAEYHVATPREDRVFDPEMVRSCVLREGHGATLKPTGEVDGDLVVYAPDQCLDCGAPQPHHCQGVPGGFSEDE